MGTQKSLVIELAEVLDRHLPRRASEGAVDNPVRLRGRLRWIGRQMLPNISTLLLVAVLILTQSVWAQPFAATNAPGPSATTVNYQGRLADNLGTPLDGNYGMSFALYDAASAGNLVWGPEIHDAVPVSDGLFSVGLGSRTTGGIPTTTWNGDRYLEIIVGGETLEPRELIRSVPIAGMALTVPDGAIGSSQLADGAVGADQIADGAISAEKLSPGTLSTITTTSSQSTVYSEILTMVGLGEDVYIPYPSTEVTIEVTEPSQILMMANAALNIQNGTGAMYNAICIDGVRIARTRSYTPDVTIVDFEKLNWMYITDVDAGTYTYSICARGNSGIEARWWMPNIHLIVLPGQ